MATNLFYGRTLLYSQPEVTHFDGDDDGGDPAAAAAAKAAADKAAADAAAKAAADEKKFTQKELEEAVIKRNKAANAQLQKLETNYQGLLQQQNLTNEQRQKLETDLEALQSQMRTKEQQIAHEQKKAAEKHQTELKTVAEQKDYYQRLFETSTIERAIQDAAISQDGFNPELFIALLGPKTKIVEETDKLGVKTGRLVPQVEWQVKDEGGTFTQVVKTPAEVVELMKDDPNRYGAMFRGNVAKGIGGGTAAGPGTPTGGSVNHRKITDEEYMKLRKDPAARKAMGLE